MTSAMLIGALVICQSPNAFAEPPSNLAMEETVINDREVVCSAIDTERVLQLNTVTDEKIEETPARYQTIAESISQEERGLLAMVVYHEARGESYDGQRAVAEVVFNRVLSDKFPNTIKEVIYQENQFSCSDALTNAAYREPGALATAFDVVEGVLHETEYAVPAHYYFFSTGSTKAASYIQIGNHTFR